MEFNDVISTRRSVRNYTSMPVEKSVIESLINAAAQAPSSMNSQPWAFGVVQDAALLRKISDQTKVFLLSLMDQAPALEKYRDSFQNPDFNVFYNAGSLVIIFARPNVSVDPIVDCALAAENLMLVARNAGLGTCWIGFARRYLNTPEGKRMLNIPEDVEIIAPIILGHPAEEFAPKEKNPPQMLFWR